MSPEPLNFVTLSLTQPTTVVAHSCTLCNPMRGSPIIVRHWVHANSVFQHPTKLNTTKFFFHSLILVVHLMLLRSIHNLFWSQKIKTTVCPPSDSWFDSRWRFWLHENFVSCIMHRSFELLTMAIDKEGQIAGRPLIICQTAVLGGRFPVKPKTTTLASSINHNTQPPKTLRKRRWCEPS